MTEAQYRMTAPQQESDDNAIQLDHFRWPYQVMMPWGGDLATASFQVGAAGVTSIQVTPWGIEIDVTRGDGKQWVLMFTHGGFGWREVNQQYGCDGGESGKGCGELFDTEVERDAHRRSHKPNHKGGEKELKQQ